MKKFFAIMLAATVLLSSCAKKEEAKTEEKADDVLKIVLLLNGNLGDKSFFDSAADGMKMIQSELGSKVETKTIEMGYDESKWEPTLLDVSDSDWDIIILGTWQMQEKLEKVAPQYPDKRYIIFDTEVQYAKYDLKNVHSIMYKQNEASFIAGVLAGTVTKSSMSLANPDKIVGFLGGMDNNVINDFLVGYIDGVQFVDKDIKVAISYVGSFSDSAKGKEMALAQYALGADIGFNVAGQAGLGLLDAAKDVQRYAIGVDSDQALIFETTDVDKANLITTSVLKRVDNSLLAAVKAHIAGTLEYGKSSSLGLAEECVGIAKNDFYKKLISSDMQSYLEEIEKKVMNGEIKVRTSFGLTTDELNEIRNSVRP